MPYAGHPTGVYSCPLAWPPTPPSSIHPDARQRSCADSAASTASSVRGIARTLLYQNICTRKSAKITRHCHWSELAGFLHGSLSRHDLHPVQPLARSVTMFDGPVQPSLLFCASSATQRLRVRQFVYVVYVCITLEMRTVYIYVGTGVKWSSQVVNSATVANS